MESRITTIEEFRTAKQKLIKKYGDKLLVPTTIELAQILKECEPMARYAKIPAEKLLSAVAAVYVEGK